jgi:acetolactate synthase small subunit
VDDAADGLIVELTGSEAFVLSCLRALERFEIVEVARSGTIALAAANNLQTETVT